MLAYCGSLVTYASPLAEADLRADSFFDDLDEAFLCSLGSLAERLGTSEELLFRSALSDDFLDSIFASSLLSLDLFDDEGRLLETLFLDLLLLDLL